MNKLMRRLSSSFGQSLANDNAMLDTSANQSNQSGSLVNDSDASSIEESQPPQIPPPPPPRPPPRRRRKQTSIFYPVLPLFNDDIRPTKRPTVPPPIPPRTVSISPECSQKMDLSEESVRPKSSCSSSPNHMFPNEELIENLTQNLSVMEDLNQRLRNEMKDIRLENTILVNELAAIHIERKQLIQTCKEIETLKDNEWVCSICLDDRQLIVSTNRQIVSTFCGHLFCYSCVNMALEVEGVCPTCRKAVPINQKKAPFIYLYF